MLVSAKSICPNKSSHWYCPARLAKTNLYHVQKKMSRWTVFVMSVISSWAGKEKVEIFHWVLQVFFSSISCATSVIPLCDGSLWQTDNLEQFHFVWFVAARRRRQQGSFKKPPSEWGFRDALFGDDWMFKCFEAACEFQLDHAKCEYYFTSRSVATAPMDECFLREIALIRFAPFWKKSLGFFSVKTISDEPCDVYTHDSQHILWCRKGHEATCWLGGCSMSGLID